ncbi:hypothetical protein [Burkholderia ambifaria]|uniref:hypothetical protein n=1 Tax=Burkholderia ambifaria TaxID=152480 RepID=UPI00158DD53F|nr:hypothetical protein [Burkholderia ambifaria]
MKITDDMLTEWFPPEIVPVNAGEYETIVLTPHLARASAFPIFSEGKWKWKDGRLCIFQNRWWRGLNKEPQRD